MRVECKTEEIRRVGWSEKGEVRFVLLIAIGV